MRFGMILAIDLTSCVLFNSNEAQAEHIDGHMLYEACSSIDYGQLDANSFKSGSCLGFVAGSVQAFIAMQVANGGCLTTLPPSSTLVQWRDITIKYLKDHPEKRSFDASTLVLFAMADAFPCPK